MKKYQTSAETSLMRYSFDTDSMVNKLMQRMREDVLNRNFSRIKPADIRAAEAEVNSLRTTLDRSTYNIQQDLNMYIFHGLQAIRALLVVEGTFIGEESLDVVLGIDLGVGKHKLFTKGIQKDMTIDEYVTRIETASFLEQEADNLLSSGYNLFQVRASRFFYFRDEDLSNFKKDGSIDMAALIPLIASMPLYKQDRGYIGYVGLTRVEPPTKEEYDLKSPQFTSHRNKKSLARKIEEKLAKELIKEEDVICDFAAHRILVATEGEAHRIESFLKSSPRIMESFFRYLSTKDSYAKREDPYNGIRVIADVTRGKYTGVRSIQIVDKNSYYVNELNPLSPVSRMKFERKKGLSNNAQRIKEAYRNCLNQIFGVQGIPLIIQK